jgi:hypothetical protein
MGLGAAEPSEDFELDELLRDVAEGRGLTLHQAAQRFTLHRLGRPVHRHTVTTWVVDGVTAPDGRVVRLAAVRVGRRWLTTEPAIRRFIQDQHPTSSPQSRPRSADDPIRAGRLGRSAAPRSPDRRPASEGRGGTEEIRP